MATRYSTSTQVPVPALPLSTEAMFQGHPFEENRETVDLEPTTEQTASEWTSNSRTNIQPKLTIGASGDAYEQEADRIADQAMAMADEIPQVQQQSTQEEEDTLQSKPLFASISTIQRQAVEEEELQAKVAEGRLSAETSEAFDDHLHHSSGGGAPLPNETRAFFEPRIGFDFSQVRVHTDSTAVQMSQAINAQAFTHGSDIYFGSGRYDPGSDSGKRLLAHELTHVVQQSGAASAPIQRAVETLGGDWDTDKYDIIADGGTEIGVDIDLKFTPKDPVNATKIGLAQAVNSIDEGSVVALNDTVRDRSIQAGETNEGLHIDQAPHNRNPLYAVEGASAADTHLADTDADPGWGQHGWHYQDASHTLQHQDAHLLDTPQLPGRGNNASQIFETSALAIEGSQEGAYYGAVRWGWRTDSAGTFTQLPLEVVSVGVPTASFMRATALWNQGQTSAGEDTLDLPTSGHTSGTVLPANMTTTQLFTRLTQLEDLLTTLPPGTDRTNIEFECQVIQRELAQREVPVPETASEEARRDFATASQAYTAGQYQEALTGFRNSYALLAGEPRAELAYDVGLAHQRLGQFAEAISMYQEHLSFSGLSDRSRALALEQIRRARQGETVPAIAPPAPTAEETQAANQDAQATFQQANEAMTAGNVSAAITLFELIYGNPALEAHVRRDMTFNLGLCHQRQGAFDQAISFYQEYAQFPGVDEAQRTLVLDRMRQCRTGATRGAADHAPALPAEEQQRIFTAGQTAFDSGQYQQALDHFEQIYATPVATATVRRTMVHNMAIAHQRLQQFDQAISLWQEYLTFSGVSEAERQEVLNKIQQARLGQVGANVTMQSEATPLVSGTERVLMNGVVYFDTGSTALGPEGQSTLNAIANLVQEQHALNPGATFRLAVIGQASQSWQQPGGASSEDLNLQLAGDRAAQVAQLLTTRLPEADRLSGIYNIDPSALGTEIPASLGEMTTNNGWRYRAAYISVWMSQAAATP